MNKTTTVRRQGHAPERCAIRPVAAACALLLLSTGAAIAQEAKPADAQSVTVTGIRRAIETSVATKRNSDSIVEAVSSEDLGKLPDASIAEALARLPGLTGQRGSDGRVNVVSIRGLAPQFGGALLNGREIVSSGDSRAVEYDQFPSELVGSVLVYKTGDASLMGQGLSGTVDIRTLKPLDVRGRQVNLNLRGEQNSNGTLVPGVASPTGLRFSASYVDQFANNTVGVALGFARLQTTTQVKQTELNEYADYTVFGMPLNGNKPSLFPGQAIDWKGPYQAQALTPMFWTATSSTKRQTRDGLMAVFDYKPNKDLRSQLDLYYSKFDTHEVGGKFLASMYATPAWGGGPVLTMSNVGTTQDGKNTLATSATIDNMPATTGNFDNKRKDTITSVGWNTTLKFADRWTAISDLSYSRDVRDEAYTEAYAAPYDYATGNWKLGSFNWNVPGNGGAQTFTPLNGSSYGAASGMAFGDCCGFNFVPGQPRWTGAIRAPHIEDEIKTVRLSLRRDLDGVFSALTGGFNFTQRDKTVDKNETRLLMPLDGNGNNIRTIPTGAVGTPFNMAWAGIGSLVRIDVPGLVASGALSPQPVFFGQADNTSSVHEKVSTLFAMLNIDTEIAKIPVRGNIGVQSVHTSQRSTGWEYRGNADVPDVSQLFPRSGGTSYNDVLPSLNLVANLQSDLIARFGLSTSTARPNIQDMRAGTSTPTLITDPGIDQGKWREAYAGNPALKPWRAAAIDLSVEKYFGKRSYVAAAAFRKNLLSYITYGVSARDNTFLPLPTNLPPGIVVQQFGPVFQPLNGTGGKVEGIELAGALEASLINKALDGFGVVASFSKLSSSIRDQSVDQNSGKVIAGSSTSLNGLSGRSNSVTFYYEKDGIAARVSQRYRSPFTATTKDIYLNSTTRTQAADKVVDLQLGYSFETGPYKGLSILLQVNNLLDKTVMNMKSVGSAESVPDPTAQYPNYISQFGRQTLLGVNYKF